MITLEKTYTINLGSIELEYTLTYNIDCEYETNQTFDRRSPYMPITTTLTFKFKELPAIIDYYFALVQNINYDTMQLRKDYVFNCTIHNNNQLNRFYNCTITSVYFNDDEISAEIDSDFNTVTLL